VQQKVMQEGLVSVIIPNYNYAHYLGEAIESVLAQTYPSIEIIVVDDGSSDGSMSVLEPYDDKITLIRQQNQGVSAARNNGAAAGRGQYVAFLDADDVWLPLKVEKQVERFLSGNGPGLVHVGLVEIDARGAPMDERLDGLEGNVVDELLLFERGVILGGGSGIIVTREIFDKVGGFDEDLSTSADWDFFVRVCQICSAAFVPEVLLKYRVHGSNMHGNLHAMERDMTRGYKKAFMTNVGVSRGRCYGNLYKALAASNYHAGNYTMFLRQMIKSAAYRPSNAAYFLSSIFRRR
jgi:glycosyltransferase involved in cell wall biosynthesis